MTADLCTTLPKDKKDKKSKKPEEAKQGREVIGDEVALQKKSKKDNKKKDGQS